MYQQMLLGFSKKKETFLEINLGGNYSCGSSFVFVHSILAVLWALFKQQPSDTSVAAHKWASHSDL